MDPDEALARFWQARDNMIRVRRNHDASVNERWYADAAIDAAADLFVWLGDGGFAPDWTRRPS